MDFWHKFQLTFTSSGNEDESYSYDTFETAVSAATAYIEKSNSAIDVTVTLPEGRFAIDETVAIDGSDFDNKEYSLAFVGAGSEKTTLTSEVVIDEDDFDYYGDGQYAYKLPESSKTDGVYPSYHDFYIDGVRIPMASSDEYILDSNPDKFDASGNLLEGDDRTIYLDADIFAGMGENDIAGAELWIKNVWNIKCVHIDSFDKTRTKTSSDGKILYAAVIRSSDWDVLLDSGSTSSTNYSGDLAGCTYWVSNSTYFLNGANVDTFVYDAANGIFYVQLDASSDVEDYTLSYPVLDTLISLNDVKNVSFTGIGFTGTTNSFVTANHYVTGQAGSVSVPTGEYVPGFLTYAAISIDSVDGMTVENCLFDNLGNDGLNFKGAVDDVTIAGNTFTEIAGSAIRMADTSGSYYDRFYDEDNHNRNIAITDNYIDGTGRTYMSSPSIQIGHVRDLTLTYNTLFNSSYSAICVGWGWRTISDEAINVYKAEIAYNYVSGFMEELQDGGAIYVLGGNASADGYYKDVRFNSIHDNFCAVTEDTVTTNYTVIYLDGSSTNWSVSNNVIFTVGAMEPSMSYISFQSVSGQQVFNCTAKDNYVVGISDDSAIYGTGLAAGDTYGLYESGSEAFETFEALLAKYPAAETIVESAGCTGHTGTLS